MQMASFIGMNVKSLKENEIKTVDGIIKLMDKYEEIK